MQSSWVKVYCRFLISKQRVKETLPLLLLLSGSTAQAVLTVNQVNGGGAASFVSGSQTTTAQPSFYYLVSTDAGITGATPPSFINFTPLSIDATATAATDSSSNSKMFQVSISLDKAVSVTGTQQAAITFFAYPNSGTAHPAPVAAVNGVLCSQSDGNSGCMALNQITSTGQNRYYAAKYPAGIANATIQLGFYPNDICASALAQGVQVTGCNNNEMIQPTTGTPSTMQLGFSVLLASDSLPSTVPSGTPIDSTGTVPLTLSFQVDTPTLNCPTSAQLQNSYTPADRSILLDTTQFSLSGTNVAPAAGIFAVGGENATPNVSSAFQTQNSYVSTPLGFMGQSVVSGLLNSTATETHAYNFSFIIKDAAGIYVPPASVGSCLLTGVQTSAIQGFLSKSNCFIATAAFRSIDSPPVVLLRQFRDEVLLHSSAGKAFVHWYYGWSPPAAEWLMLNPVYRFPVLWFLSELEGAVWLVMHPFELVLILFFSLFSGIFIYRMNRADRIRKISPLISLFLCLSGGVCFESESHAAQEVGQPYIDQIKREMKEGSASEGPNPNSGDVDPYIQNIRKNLPTESLNQESYIESLHKTDPKLRGEPSQESYIEKLKPTLEPSKEGGAIQAVAEGNSALSMKREGQISRAFGLRYGVTANRNYSATSQSKDFNSIYGGNYAPDLSFFYEIQPFHSELLGSFGIIGMGGVSYFHGTGQFALNLQKPGGSGSFGATSNTQFQFFTLPATLALTYRFNLFRYLRPYGFVGPTVIGFTEMRSDSQSGNRGFSKGVTTTLGLSFLLDWLSSDSTWSLYTAFGIKHFYLTLDYSRLTTFSSDVNFNGSGLFAGLTFEL